MDTYFKKKLVAGKLIRPFLVTGVLEKDYPDERTGKAMRAYIEKMMTQAGEEFSNKEFREFDSFTVCDMEGKWTVCDAQSPKYADGHYYITEKFGLMPIYLELESECEQEITIKIPECRLVVLLNGSVVYNNTDLSSRKRPRRYVFEHVVNPNCEMVTLKLKAGKNTLIAVSGKVDRGTGISLSMELVSCEAPLFASVPLNMDENVRAEIFRSQLETHLEDDIYEEGEIPKICVGGYPFSNCVVELNVLASKKQDETQSVVFSLTLGAEDDRGVVEKDGMIAMKGITKPGEYTVNIAWKLLDGTPLTEKTVSFSIEQVLAPYPGWEHFEERRQLTLERLASQGNALALYRLGRADEIDHESIRVLCDKIEKRKDCADFELLPLLWLMWEDKDAGLLDPGIVEMVKHASLGFRYWVDEPGTSSMFYCSENHRIGFHVCEYLAGLLYPEDIFTNCGQNGMYHS